MNDLIARLRTARLLSLRNQFALQDEAAEALSRQQAENAELIHDLERQMDVGAYYVNEAERLRAALEMIEGISAGSKTTNSLPHINKIAHATLTKKDTPDA